MNQVLIVEGCDGAGKTQLCDTLAKDHGFKVQHTGVPKLTWSSKDLFSNYVSTLWKALNDRQPVVFDRHYLGETIYGPIMRGRSLLSEVQKRLIERVVMANDVKVILCIPPRPVAFDNWKAKKKDYVDREAKWDQIFTAYDRLSDRYPVYDYTDTFEDAVPLCKLLIPGDTLPPSVTGSPQAQLLLVGERVNTKLTSRDWAFFADSGSSGFLNVALAESDIPERDLALVNALNVRGNEKDFGLILKALPECRQVVALGKTASRVLRDQSVSHLSLPHPAYVKRFHANDHTYAEDLKKVYEGVTCQPAC